MVLRLARLRVRSDMGRVERAAMAAGARRALERMREVAPANMSEGGRQVYREILQGGPEGDTAQKLRMLIGDDATDRLVHMAHRKTGFRSVHNAVASKFPDCGARRAYKDMQTPQMPEISAAGAVNRLPFMPVETGVRSMLQQGTERTREGIANIPDCWRPQRRSGD